LGKIDFSDKLLAGDCLKEEKMQLPPCVIQTLQRWFPSADLTRANVVSSGFRARLTKRMKRAGFTFGRTVLLGEGDYDPFSPRGLALIAHELKHVLQYENKGTAKFVVRYLWDWGRLGRYSKKIPFENEAYDLEEKVKEHLIREFSANGDRGPCLRDETGNVIANADYQELPVTI
jgi:hypothetical protein